MLETLKRAYSVLERVFLMGAYASIELNKQSEHPEPALTRIVYGVLDNNVKLEYFLSQLFDKKPKSKIYIILKISLFCLLFMDNMPSYAVTDAAVELTKSIGKKEVSGFVNAVLKRAAGFKFVYPEKKSEYLSVFYSKPLNLVKYYISRYGEQNAEEILSTVPYEKEHIRFNSRKIDRKTFEKTLQDKGIEYERSEAGGYYVRNSSGVKELFNSGLITFQSLTSMLAVQAMGIREGDNVLDACAAPGGKSVYISELTSATVLASDIHPHRVELIKKYALRMGADNVKAEVRDAAIFDPTLQETFDYILADVPCSGLGVIGKKPDILINYDKRDIANLSITQYNILCNVSRYVKRGGIILYSTCTTLYEENEGVIERFYRENNGYEPAGEEKYINFLPDSKGRDGFFIARIRRK